MRDRVKDRVKISVVFSVRTGSEINLKFTNENVDSKIMSNIKKTRNVSKYVHTALSY